MDTFAVSIFLLGVSHLFNRHTLALLAFDNAFRGDASLAVLCITDDQLHELGVICRRIIEQ